MQAHDDFSSIIKVAQVMSGFCAPWFISGGWAIDVFLGEVTRLHCDIEIGIYRCDQEALQRYLSDWTLQKAIDSPEGGRWVAWEAGEELQLPIHQLKATRREGEGFEFDVFLNQRSATHWISRRHAGVRQPISQAVLISSGGIPVLAPEIQLLFKAKYFRDKDQRDFELAAGRLSETQREWLAEALGKHHPSHPWIGALGKGR
jgi:hypothetical protein